MTYFKFRWLFFLIIFVLGGYYLLLFFSNLTDIDIFSVIVWGFRSGVSTGKGLWLFLFLAILLYPFLFTAVVLFLEIPVHIFRMKNHHVGGLLGYGDESAVRVYDPSRNTYVAYEHFNPPEAAHKFTEAFEVVLFYKFRPSSKNYRETRLRSLSSQLGLLVVAVVGLFVVSVSLYGLVDSYIEEMGLQIQLSTEYLASQFLEHTGLTLVKALLIALSIYVLALGAGIISVNKLNNHYKSLYASDQQALRSKLLNSISPMETITGRVIGRCYNTESRSHSEGSENNTGHSEGRGGKTIYYTEDVYIVEFRDLIHIPVYLILTILPSKSARKEEKMLNRLFSDDSEDIPTDMPELDFTVNPDYSVSLKRE